MTKYSNITLKWGLTDDARALRLAPAVVRRATCSARTARSSCSTARAGEGALELLQRLAEQVGRADFNAEGQRRRDRDAGARARRRGEGEVSHVPDRVSIHAAVGYLDEEGTLHRDGTMRLATAADEILPLQGPARAEQPGLPDRDPAVARGHAAGRRRRRSTRRSSRRCSPPTWRTCRSSTTASTSWTTSAPAAAAARSCQHELRRRRSRRRGGFVGYPLEQLHRGGSLRRLSLPLAAREIMALEHARSPPLGARRSRRSTSALNAEA